MHRSGIAAAGLALLTLWAVGCGTPVGGDAAPQPDASGGDAQRDAPDDASAGPCPQGQFYCPGCPGQAGTCSAGGCPGYNCPLDGSGGGPPPPADAGDAQGRVACGAQTCGAGDVCVQPCCGGNAPPCTARPEGGSCPIGTTAVSSCPGAPQGPGCMPNPCDPPPPFCLPVPSSCNGSPQCSCMPGACTGGGSCAAVTAGKVSCVCA